MTQTASLDSGPPSSAFSADEAAGPLFPPLKYISHFGCSLEQLNNHSSDTMGDEICDCETDEFVGKIRRGMLDDDTIFDIADLFKVFADSTRVRIMWALHESEMCVRGISKSLNISMSAASHQLKTLKDADLVASRRSGKQVYYSLCDEHIEMLLSTALAHIKEEKRWSASSRSRWTALTAPRR